MFLAETLDSQEHRERVQLRLQSTGKWSLSFPHVIFPTWNSGGGGVCMSYWEKFHVFICLILEKNVSCTGKKSSVLIIMSHLLVWLSSFAFGGPSSAWNAVNKAWLWNVLFALFSITGKGVVDMCTMINKALIVSYNISHELFFPTNAAFYTSFVVRNKHALQ